MPVYKWMLYSCFFFKLQTEVKFWFPTGGAGYCISRALAKKMHPYMGR